MKNKFILLLPLLLFSFCFVSSTTTYGNPLTEDTGLTLNGFADSVGYAGVFIEPNADIQVISIGRTNYGNSTNVYIVVIGGQVIAQAPFVEDTATFNPSPTLNNGTRYAIISGNDDASAIKLNYVASIYSFPIVGNNFNYVGGINTMNTLDEIYYWNNPSDVVADVQNITTRNITISTPPTYNGILKFWDFDKLEQTGQVIEEPQKTSFSLSNLFQNIWNWIRGLFN